MRLLPILLLYAALLLTACTDPHVGAGIGIGPHGATIRPVISGAIPGGGRISYSP
ncbi:hypothetical protein [Cypionkella sp.]|jgi:predicted small secreted protein|uniref:hypothetical protein n=1 Tax=Cypionkella sp. TaxID=2811411 RepID=UPI00271C4822|nr:hypothetical protein [Cypionkella sp.]MDO8982618.1 hypothetical protein [Cypionkella sp.]MDP1575327.1 hypothetical protein [Cypionkella sp.]MDP2049936.1 hypothetical protein [Cypionkella sp.]